VQEKEQGKKLCFIIGNSRCHDFVCPLDNRRLMGDPFITARGLYEKTADHHEYHAEK
jgi:hypothetical protein